MDNRPRLEPLILFLIAVTIGYFAFTFKPEVPEKPVSNAPTEGKVESIRADDKKIIESFKAANPQLKDKRLSVAYDHNGDAHVLVQDE